MFTKRASAVVLFALCTTLAACGGGDKNNTNNSTANQTPNNMSTNTNNNMSTQNIMNMCDTVANSCATAGSSCSGDSAVVCAADANGCLVETTTDCTATNQVCMGGACVDPGTCDDDPACSGLTDGARFCTADVLTTCTANAMGCLVASTNDCAAASQTCDMDTQMCVTACSDDAACMGLADGDTYCDMASNGFITCAANAQGCLEPTTTACNAGEVCDATSGTAMCASSCPDAIQALSCADAGMTISGDTANGSMVINENGCTFAGEDYSANEAIFTFQDMGNYDVSVAYTFDNAAIEFDAFALRGDGVCTDPALTCEGTDYGFSSPGELTFGAEADQLYYLVLDPYNAPAETTGFGITITCTAPVCGDGVIGAGEECDDMNTTDGDGCDMNCAIEPNYLCTGEPSTCILEVCGDGVITASEECDDMNTTDGDGCDMNCAEEANYICTGEPSTCIPDVCGDGTLSPNETCDDGNTADGDGCDMNCEVEFGYQCDATGANCAAIPSIGTFGAGDAIPDQSGGPILAGEHAYYMITFTDAVLLSGTASVGTTGDVDVRISDSTGVSFMTSGAVGDETWTDQLIPAGTYLIDLLAYSSDGDIDTYLLTLATTALATTDIGTFAAAAAIADTTGGPIAADSNDYYTITFSDDVVITGTLTSDADADIYVYSSGGTILAGSAITGDEDFEFGLLAGTYTIQINAYGADITSYTLSMATAALTATDLGSFAAGDTINDQTGTLLDGASDYYKITFSTDVSLTGTLGGNTTGETGVLIYSTSTFPVGEFNFGDESFTNDVVAGTYLIRIISNPGDGDVDAYTLTLDPN